MAQHDDPVPAFLDPASVPLEGWHASGTLEEANRILAERPEVAEHDLYTAAVLGDDAAVRRFVAADPALARAKGGPRGWDPLTYLCFSRFLRLDTARSDGFVRAAEALLDAGANPDTGWFEAGHQPHPVWESALYGAAGVAHHKGVTRLLLARGANPNDDETSYHAPEWHDLDVVKASRERRAQRRQPHYHAPAEDRRPPRRGGRVPARPWGGPEPGQPLAQDHPAQRPAQ